MRKRLNKRLANSERKQGRCRKPGICPFFLPRCKGRQFLNPSSGDVLHGSGTVRSRSQGCFFPDGDYKLYLSSEQPEEEIMAAGNPLNEELRQEILSVDRVMNVLVIRRSLHARCIKGV